MSIRARLPLQSLLTKLPRLPRTLTARLVLIVVCLVAAVAVLVGALTSVLMSQYMVQRLDVQVHASIDRTGGDGPQDRDHDQMVGGDPGPPSPLPLTGGIVRSAGCTTFRGPMTPGALIVGRTRRTSGTLDDYGCLQPLSATSYREVQRVPADGQVHTVKIAGSGSYRIARSSVPRGNVAGVGLPLEEIHRTIGRLTLWSGMLGLTAVLLAAVAGSWLVRRQLRPLRAVASTANDVSRLPLAEGGQTIATRVPARYTDPATEAGQVGAALNTLLAHVDAALAARHRSEQQVRQFVADASHELRTPLATIHGYAELSRRHRDDASALTTALDKVETEATRMSHLVDDLLLLARLDAGRPLAREEVDVTRLLLEAVADANVVAPSHNWRLDLPDEPITVTGDAERLHQVVTNLITNARRHTPAGTTVTVAAENRGEQVAITVHDNGPGMPPDLVEHVFERFTRGDSSRTRDSGGAGLGLSLVQAIATAHRGRARVTSVPGDTTFTVLLPAG